MKNLPAIFIMFSLLLSGCNNTRKKDKTDYNTDNYSGAERFSLEKHDDYTILKIINPWQGAKNIEFEYYLVKRGIAIPHEIKDTSRIIFVPVRKIICMSVTHAAMVTALGEEKSITGVSGADFIYSEKLNERIKSGFIKDVGYESGLNSELILDLHPEIMMIYGIGGESEGYMRKLKELGVRLLFIGDYLETDPLAKAEWIRVFGALYCKGHTADSLYLSEAGEYKNIKEHIRKKVSTHPSVLLGLPYRDTWFISPGNSYISVLVADAGGKYIWGDTKSDVSMPFGLENVYMKALTADFWLNTGAAASKAEIASIDNRLTQLPAYKNGNLYNYNRRVTGKGGNDYWEKGSYQPHLILKDIATILHPELFPGSELFFYKKLN